MLVLFWCQHIGIHPAEVCSPLLCHLFPHVYYSHACASDYSQLHTWHKRTCHLDALLLIQVCLGAKFCSLLRFLKVLPLEFLLGTPKKFLCSVSLIQGKIVVLLGTIQLLMLRLGTLSYLEVKRIVLIKCDNVTFLIIKVLVAVRGAGIA
jgi:hypothetical protein